MSNVLKKTFKLQEVTLKALKNEASYVFRTVNGSNSLPNLSEEVIKVINCNKDVCKILYAYGRLDNLGNGKLNIIELSKEEREEFFEKRNKKIDSTTPLGVFIRANKDVASTVYLLGATASYLYN